MVLERIFIRSPLEWYFLFRSTRSSLGDDSGKIFVITEKVLFSIRKEHFLGIFPTFTFGTVGKGGGYFYVECDIAVTTDLPVIICKCEKNEIRKTLLLTRSIARENLVKSVKKLFWYSDRTYSQLVTDFFFSKTTPKPLPHMSPTWNEASLKRTFKWISDDQWFEEIDRDSRRNRIGVKVCQKNLEYSSKDRRTIRTANVEVSS